ncbi:DUF6283 family protein [Actinomadura verrucosospora]|uniref:Uncharacterized protein n=1 Tax=Actinomadura verrucosospora TaxID=46165 RepID=A0A7D3VP12_ACTVE|nr:DUF6283 family protein [Actinomadura verrucosospora]QKG19118.1 hypothetical protein ACTIVE_0754 [Actinomadura verrucosospora]
MANNLQVRLWLAQGAPLWRVRLPTGVELYGSHRQMAVANGVDPADPALAACRDDGTMHYRAPAPTQDRSRPPAAEEEAG